MEVIKESFHENPERVVSEDFDGIWMLVGSRANPEPLKTEACQWIDWKMHGQLSRMILRNDLNRGEPVFIPTMKSISAHYVAVLNASQWNSKKFFEDCAGLKLKKVLCLCEETSFVANVEKDLKSAKGEFPEVVLVGT